MTYSKCVWLLLAAVMACEAQVPSPQFLAVGESVKFTASGSPFGVYSWSSAAPSIAAASNGFLGAQVTIVGISPGRTTVTVNFKNPNGDVSSSIDVIVYDVTTFLLVTPGKFDASDPTGKEVDANVGAVVTVDAGSEKNIEIPLRLNFSFTDPDDTAGPPVIDSNGDAGDDNAPVLNSGRRGAVKMWDETSSPPVGTDNNGQTALTFFKVKSLQPATPFAVFRASNVAGDNYKFKIQLMTRNGRILKEATTAGIVPVRRSLVFNQIFETPSGAAVASAALASEVDPVFSGDGYTDYQRGTVHILPAPVGDFLVITDIPNAAETPTAQERSDFLSGNAAAKEAARVAITAKAQAWHDRISVSTGGRAAIEDLQSAVGALSRDIPSDKSMLLGVKKIFDKEDGDPTTGHTDHYPDGIQIKGGGDSGEEPLDPNGEWRPLKGHVFELNQSLDPNAKIMIVSLGATADELRFAARHIAAHASFHTPFGGFSDHSLNGGLMDSQVSAPITPARLKFSDQEILCLRGWTGLPFQQDSLRSNKTWSAK